LDVIDSPLDSTEMLETNYYNHFMEHKILICTYLSVT